MLNSNGSQRTPLREQQVNVEHEIAGAIKQGLPTYLTAVGEAGIQFSGVDTQDILSHRLAAETLSRGGLGPEPGKIESREAARAYGLAAEDLVPRLVESERLAVEQTLHRLRGEATFDDAVEEAQKWVLDPAVAQAQRAAAQRAEELAQQKQQELPQRVGGEVKQGDWRHRQATLGALARAVGEEIPGQLTPPEQPQEEEKEAINRALEHFRKSHHRGSISQVVALGLAAATLLAVFIPILGWIAGVLLAMGALVVFVVYLRFASEADRAKSQVLKALQQHYTAQLASVGQAAARRFYEQIAPVVQEQSERLATLVGMAEEAERQAVARAQETPVAPTSLDIELADKELLETLFRQALPNPEALTKHVQSIFTSAMAQWHEPLSASTLRRIFVEAAQPTFGFVTQIPLERVLQQKFKEGEIGPLISDLRDAAAPLASLTGSVPGRREDVWVLVPAGARQSQVWRRWLSALSVPDQNVLEYPPGIQRVAVRREINFLRPENFRSLRDAWAAYQQANDPDLHTCDPDGLPPLMEMETTDWSNLTPQERFLLLRFWEAVPPPNESGVYAYRDPATQVQHELGDLNEAIARCQEDRNGRFQALLAAREQRDPAAVQQQAAALNGRLTEFTAGEIERTLKVRYPLLTAMQ